MGISPAGTQERAEFTVLEATEVVGERVWRVVLAAPGASSVAVAAGVVRAALAVARAVEDAAGIDLVVVDPDDATTEVRVRLDRADLDTLDLAGLGERDLVALAA